MNTVLCLLAQTSISVSSLPPVEIKTDYTSLALNALLVIVTAFTFVAILYQAVKTKDAVLATQKSADASQKSADALIASERAWIVGLKTSQVFVHAPRQNENIVYHCLIKNAGRTPSRIMEVRVAFRRISSLEEIPLEPTYQDEEMTVFNKIVVVPNDHIEMLSKLSPPLAEDEYSSIKLRKLFLYAYGYVKYLDVYSRGDQDYRETRFCHYYYISAPGDPPEEGFLPCIQAPAKYHDAT